MRLQWNLIRQRASLLFITEAFSAETRPPVVHNSTQGKVLLTGMSKSPCPPSASCHLSAFIAVTHACAHAHTCYIQVIRKRIKYWFTQVLQSCTGRDGRRMETWKDMKMQGRCQTTGQEMQKVVAKETKDLTAKTVSCFQWLFPATLKTTFRFRKLNYHHHHHH